MLYQPTNVYPSLTGALGNGVVDANNNLTVSWQVNGNSALQMFSITIYKNDTNSTQVYSTGIQSKGCPFYGTDYAGNVHFFSYTISASALATAGIVNGENYKIKIKQWWGIGEFVDQTSPSAFITRATPSIAVDVVPTPLNQRSYTFYATYTQAQHDALNWVRWELENENEGDTVDDTGKIYGTSQLQYSYDGFADGHVYYIRCTIQTENGVELASSWVGFLVSYGTSKLQGEFLACQSNRGNGVKLSLPTAKDIPAEITGDYDISNSIARLQSGTTAKWMAVNGAKMSFNAPFNFVWRGKSNATGTFAEVIGDGHGYSEMAIKSDVNGLTFTSANNLPFSTVESPSVCYGNGKYVMACSLGVAYSEDGITWTAVSSYEFDSSDTGWSVCFGNGLFYAVSTNGTMIYSTDGVNWQPHTPLKKPCRRISFANDSFFVTYLNSGLAKCEPPAYTDWKDISMPNVGYYSVAYGNGVYIATNADEIAYSYDGITWSTTSVPNTTVKSVCYGNGVFIAINDNEESTTGLYSYNGRTWSVLTLPSSAVWNAIAYGNGTFMLVGENEIRTSEDGFSWSENLNSSATFDAVCFGNGKFSVIPSSTAGALITNDVTKTISIQFDDTTVLSTQIPESEEMTIIVDDTAAYVSVDKENLTWKSGSVPTVVNGSEGVNVGYGNGRYVEVSSYGSALYSEDGINWVQSTPYGEYSGSYANARIVYGAGKFYVYQYSSYGYAMRSVDGVTWEQFTTNVTETQFETVIYDGTKFCAVGSNYHVYTSLDGQIWEQVSTISIRNSSCIRLIFANGVYVALFLENTNPAFSTIACSNDLVNWKLKTVLDAGADSLNGQTSGTWTSTIYDGTYGNGYFVIHAGYVSDGSSYSEVFLRSDDGENWTASVANVDIGDQTHIVFYKSSFFTYSNNPVAKKSSISNDGVKWKYVDFPYHGTFSVCAGGKLIAFEGDSSAAAYSDGIVDLKPASIGENFTKITRIILNGFQECDYVLVSDGNLSEDQKENILYNSSYQPRDIKALFYADFDSSANAGGFGSTGVTNFAIYRTSPGYDEKLTHICDMAIADGDTVIDASASNGIPYVYYAYENGSGTNGALESSQITTCIWDWSILSCTQDSDGTYHPQQIFTFGKNLTTGDTSNNNTPQILQNFTQYPTVQKAPFNYKSGTLTSLIGTITEGKYSDTAKLRNDILELSTTSNTLFLKSRKGDIIKIRVSGPIEYSTMDNSATQAQTVKVPWVEDGSADESKIIITPNDITWPY